MFLTFAPPFRRQMLYPAELQTHILSDKKIWGGRTRTSEMAVPKTAALPLGDTPVLLITVSILLYKYGLSISFIKEKTTIANSLYTIYQYKKLQH